MMKIRKAKSKTGVQKVGYGSSANAFNMKHTVDSQLLTEEALDRNNVLIGKGTKKKQKKLKVLTDFAISNDEINVYNGTPVMKAVNKKSLKKQNVCKEQQEEIGQCKIPGPTNDGDSPNCGLDKKPSSKKKPKKQKFHSEEHTNDSDICSIEANVLHGEMDTKVASKKKLKKQIVRLEEPTNDSDIPSNEANVLHGEMDTKVASKKKLKKHKVCSEEQDDDWIGQCKILGAANNGDSLNGELDTKPSPKKKRKKQKVSLEEQDDTNNEANVCNNAPVASKKLQQQNIRSKEQAQTIDEPMFNIDQWKNPLESEKHWALRRAFLEKNQHVLPPDELICLAQVYINMEIYGCTYPSDTMQLVAKCSEGLGKDYYHEKAIMLKRTLVSASDAAACKVKKLNPMDAVKQNTVALVSANATSSKDEIPTYVLNCLRSDLIIINNDMRQTMNTFNSLSNGMRIQARTCEVGQGMFNGFVEIGDIAIGKSSHCCRKAALNMALNNAIQFLSKHCYSLTLKKQLHQLSGVEVVTKLKLKEQAEPENADATARLSTDATERLSTDNVGFKLLAKLGWSGGGLGIDGAGIVDPVTVHAKKGRKGLGLNEVRTSKGKLDHSRIKTMLEDFKNGKTEDRHIVFSNEYSKEERHFVHMHARRIGLKSKSYGSDNTGERRLVVTREGKTRPIDLLRKILLEKDPTFCEMYEVTLPTEQL